MTTDNLQSILSHCVDSEPSCNTARQHNVGKPLLCSISEASWTVGRLCPLLLGTVQQMHSGDAQVTFSLPSFCNASVKIMLLAQRSSPARDKRMKFHSTREPGTGLECGLSMYLFCAWLFKNSYFYHGDTIAALRVVSKCF